MSTGKPPTRRTKPKGQIAELVLVSFMQYTLFGLGAPGRPPLKAPLMTRALTQQALSMSGWSIVSLKVPLGAVNRRRRFSCG